MSELKIRASESRYLPSPIQLSSWLDDWRERAGGQWGPYLIAGSICSVPYHNADQVMAVEAVNETISDYNLTHPGMETIYVTWPDELAEQS